MTQDIKYSDIKAAVQGLDPASAVEVAQIAQLAVKKATAEGKYFDGSTPGAVTTVLPTTAERRAIAAGFNAPAIVRARTWAEEIQALTDAGKATPANEVCKVGRHFRHSTNNELYYCRVAGTMGTAEPAFVPADYVGASPNMTPTGGTAIFAASGRVSRPTTMANPPKVSIRVYGSSAGLPAFKAGSQKIDLSPLPQYDGVDYEYMPDGPHAAGQKAFRSLAGRRWGGYPGLTLYLKGWRQPKPSTTGLPIPLGFLWNGVGSELEADVYTDTLVIGCNGVGLKPKGTIHIDGVTLFEDPLMMTFLNDGSFDIVIEFAGGHGRHRVRTEMSDGTAAVYVSRAGWIKPATHEVSRMIIQTDSIGGVNMSVDYGWESAANGKISHFLGMGATRDMSIGGTGYKAKGSVNDGGTIKPNNDSALEVITLNPNEDWKDKASCYLFCHINNDGILDEADPTTAQARADVRAAAFGCWDRARANQAYALIAVVGEWSIQFSGGNSAAKTAASENWLYSIWNEWKTIRNDSRTAFLRRFTDSDGNPASPVKGSRALVYDVGMNPSLYNNQKWGTTMVGAVAGGNSNWYIGDDIHGTEYATLLLRDLIGPWLDAELEKRGL